MPRAPAAGRVTEAPQFPTAPTRIPPDSSSWSASGWVAGSPTSTDGAYAGSPTLMVTCNGTSPERPSISGGVCAKASDPDGWSAPAAYPRAWGTPDLQDGGSHILRVHSHLALRDLVLFT